MNEMDLLTKIEGLEKAIKEHNDFSTSYNEKLKLAKQELIDLHKPELTTSQAEAIEMAISQAVEKFDFDDTDNYETDFHIDYDNRIAIESMSFHNVDELVREIYNQLEEFFGVAEADEDNNQENQD